jgi:hypothetical protein
MARPGHGTVANRGSGSRRRRTNGDTEAADWSKVDADVLRSLICAVTAQGGAVRFGYSRDGGALAVGFLGDGDPYTEWIRPSEDAVEALGEMIDLWLVPPEPK